MSPAELRQKILAGQTLEDHQLLVLLWGKGGGSAPGAVTSRAKDLLDAAGGLDAWIEKASSDSLRRQGVSEARAARLLAAVEIARRTRASQRPKLEAMALSALELVAVTLDSIADEPSSRDVTLCVDMIRNLRETTLALGAEPGQLESWYEELLDRLGKSRA